MPNHIMNRVTFLGKKENVERAVETLGPDFDLNKVAEEPAGLKDEVSCISVEAAKEYFEKHGGEDPKEYFETRVRLPLLASKEKILTDFLKCVENKRRYGYCWWYEWRMENWGTKWNTYDHGDFGTFLTANSPCREAYRKISKQFGITVKALFADEDTGYNCGIITAKNGTITEWNPEPGSDGAIEFSESVWNS